MTTCSECLTILSTTRLSEIAQNPAIAEHVETCPGCSRLVTEMKYAEHRLALGLESSIPGMPPTVVASSAITAAEREHRESIAKWVRRSLALAAGIIAAVFLRSDTGRYMTGADDFVRQSIQISCLSASPTMETVRPMLQSTRSRIYASPDMKLITVQGQDAEVRAVIARIESMNRSSCGLPDARPAAPDAKTIPADGKAGKD